MFRVERLLGVVVPPMAVSIVAIGAWHLCHAVFDIEEIIFPTPLSVVISCIKNWRELLEASTITMIEATVGFVLGSSVAFVCAIAFSWNILVRRAFYPYAVALKSTPLIALAPLIVMWFGNGLLSKIVMAALVAFFPVLVNSVEGLTSVEKELLLLMKTIGASKKQVMFKIRIPHAMPMFVASLQIASSLAVVGAIIGEFTGASQGIGFLINTASYYLETDLLFAAVLAIAICGISFFYAVSYVGGKLVFWAEPDSEGGH